MVISFPEVFAATLPVFLLLGLGVVLRKSNWLPDAVERSLLRMIIYIFYPALIFLVVGENEAIANPATVMVAPLVGFGSIVLGFSLAYWMGKAFGLQKGSGRRTFAFNTGIYNFGYLPIPLVIALYGREDGTLAVLFVHNVGVDVAFWTVGILLIQGAFGMAIFRRIINPPLVALVLAVTMNWMGAFQAMPAFSINFLTFLGDCAIPLGIILAGCAIGQLLSRDAFKGGWKIMAGACVLRLAIIPVIFLTLAFTLPFETSIQRVIAIQAAMPAGVFPLVVTRFYGGREDVAIRVVISTVILSIITTPLWIQVGLKLL